MTRGEHGNRRPKLVTRRKRLLRARIDDSPDSGLGRRPSRANREVADGQIRQGPEDPRENWNAISAALNSDSEVCPAARRCPVSLPEARRVS